MSQGDHYNYKGKSRFLIPANMTHIIFCILCCDGMRRPCRILHCALFSTILRILIHSLIGNAQRPTNVQR